jgi:uncharacterized protein YjbJ (UPF0337 family)
MDKQRVNGAIDEVVGGAKRQIGNLTGDTRTEVAGALQQVKGKVETAVGKFKDGVRYADKDLDAQHKAQQNADRDAIREDRTPS